MCKCLCYVISLFQISDRTWLSMIGWIRKTRTWELDKLYEIWWSMIIKDLLLRYLNFVLSIHRYNLFVFKREDFWCLAVFSNLLTNFWATNERISSSTAPPVEIGSLFQIVDLLSPKQNSTWYLYVVGSSVKKVNHLNATYFRNARNFSILCTKLHLHNAVQDLFIICILIQPIFCFQLD